MNPDFEKKFGPYSQLLFHSYLKILHFNSGAAVVIEEIARASKSVKNNRFITNLLNELNWRPHLVASIAVLTHPARSSFSKSLWKAIDRGSWVSPQLLATLRFSDPEFVARSVERLNQGCPIIRTDSLTPIEKHVFTGPGSSDSRSGKNASAIAALLKEMHRFTEVQDPNALQRLIEKDFDNGGDIAVRWTQHLYVHYNELGIPLEV